MSREMEAKIRPKAVAITMIPLWSVGVIVSSGADWPGSNCVPLFAMEKAKLRILACQYGMECSPYLKEVSFMIHLPVHESPVQLESTILPDGGQTAIETLSMSIAFLNGTSPLTR